MDCGWSRCFACCMFFWRRIVWHGRHASEKPCASFLQSPP
jgi:hypothetical protein